MAEDAFVDVGVEAAVSDDDDDDDEEEEDDVEEEDDDVRLLAFAGLVEMPAAAGVVAAIGCW